MAKEKRIVTRNELIWQLTAEEYCVIVEEKNHISLYQVLEEMRALSNDELLDKYYTMHEGNTNLIIKEL